MVILFGGFRFWCLGFNWIFYKEFRVGVREVCLVYLDLDFGYLFFFLIVFSRLLFLEEGLSRRGFG